MWLKEKLYDYKLLYIADFKFPDWALDLRLKIEAAVELHEVTWYDL